jgi:hypothetical protein
MTIAIWIRGALSALIGLETARRLHGVPTAGLPLILTFSRWEKEKAVPMRGVAANIPTTP